MADIVNLRTARKQKARDAKKAVAAERRASSGETKAARDARRREAEGAAVKLDGHQIDPDRRP